MAYQYDSRDRLPKCAGIYRLQQRALMGWRDIYIGQSVNLERRWTANGDRRHQHLAWWQQHQHSSRLIVRPCWACNLDYREAQAIKKYNPRLNRQRPRPERYWSIMVLAEDLVRALPWVVMVIVGAAIVAATTPHVCGADG